MARTNRAWNRLGLLFRTEDNATDILMDDELVASVPYLVEHPASIMWAVQRHYPGRFIAETETAALKQHVARMKVLGQPCSLCQRDHVMGVSVCGSVLPCRYRRWDQGIGMPICGLNATTQKAET